MQQQQNPETHESPQILDFAPSEHKEDQMAEGVRFEPTEPFGSPVFKTGAIDHSTTPPLESSLWKRILVCVARDFFSSEINTALRMGPLDRYFQFHPADRVAHIGAKDRRDISVIAPHRNFI